ncbi:glucose 1-dehydrogenase [Rhodobacteraceae bacterium RKSG542]|uniref:glucose 1-dehydrogenase n=1 Tax=Pseudovibrio flavus TaxID=2529854 RepID=UPI0012BB59C5|nr:glucose 1-dehydrogenase [Pseudovibrio flavus]MTI15660.1 glucose 1-dehydrogenase [Pseudovibrio flavus]
MSRFDLTGKRALVTGSARGIGFSLAKGLAEHGAEVIINATTQQGAEAAAQALVAEGFKAKALAFNVTDEAEVVAAIAKIEEEIGQIDILVNNAGIQKRTPLVDCPKETWDLVMDVNVTGPFLLCREVGRRMKERKAGKVINICSLMSDLGRASIVPYTASKGAVKMLTKGMATEMAKDGIQVNGIGPGYFATEMNTALVEDEDFSNWLCRRTPAGRWGNVDELVGTCIFLASPAADFVNGQVIFVDGGITAAI